MTKSLKLQKSKALTFSIIIPNYNGASFLTDCLNSLTKAITNCPNSNFELIFVDNGSKDNSCQIFTDFFKKVSLSSRGDADLSAEGFQTKIIYLPSNNGFAGAVNLGIEKAKHEWVVLLNNDLTMEPNWFQLISQNIKDNKDKKVATFFGTVLTKDGTKIESQGLDFFYSGKCQNVSNGQKFSPSTTDDRRPTIYVWGSSAALVVYNKKIITKIGLFDQDFFAYEEDVDLALRLHNLGFKTLYNPQALSYHLGGGTSNKMGIFRYKMDVKNWIYIIIKNFSKKEILDNLSSIIEQRLINLSGLNKQIIYIYKLKSFFYLPYIFISVYGEVLLNLPKMFNKRQQINKLKIHQGTSL